MVFIVLSETAVVLYKVINIKESEGGIRFDDSTFDIDWEWI
jgi:dTDP-4-dehydrorhamnose 3,5-epimerase-like enzyme